MEIKQFKISAILSYALIAVNSIYGIVITPYILSKLGTSEYGVYKIIGSFSAGLMVLDLGIGNTVMRYIAKFNAEDEREKMENFSAMSMIQAVIISVVMIVVSAVMYRVIDPMYGSRLTDLEIIRAKQLFIILIISMCFHVFENVIYGIIAGCNEFVFANSIKLASILLRFVLIYGLLNIMGNSVILVLIDLGITILIIIAEFVYIYKSLLLRIKYYFWDKSLFVESMKYTLLLFIQSIAIQFNGNVDNMVVGSLVGAGAVAVYSIGLQLYNMYEQFALAFSNILLPTITNQITAGATNYELENTVIRVGRFQFCFLGGVLAGFSIIGKEFICLWLGNDYIDAWAIAMILMVPTIIPLVENVCISILRAKNKLKFRTRAVAFMAIFNLIITVIGVKYFGYMAAAIGTATGLIGANIIAMNIYYYNVLKINVFRIFREVFRRILLCLIVSSIVLYLVNIFIFGSWLMFLFKVLTFILVYGCLILFYGLNKSELDMILPKRERGR